jgi:hypothetical protein
MEDDMAAMVTSTRTTHRRASVVTTIGVLVSLGLTVDDRNSVEADRRRRDRQDQRQESTPAPRHCHRDLAADRDVLAFQLSSAVTTYIRRPVIA